MKKRVLSLLLSLAMVLTLLSALSIPISASTCSGSCGADGDNLIWTLDTDTGLLAISGSGAMNDWQIDWSIYAGGFGGYYDPDLCNTPWFWYAEEICRISLPDGLTHIGNNAFYFCSSLSDVTIPDTVTSIGDYAFLSSSKLKSVTIPASVTSIGDHAFGYNADFEKTKDFIIYGCPGTAAEDYARTNEFEFVASGGHTGFCGAEGNGSNLSWSFDSETGLLTIEGSGAMAEYCGLGVPAGSTPFEVSPINASAPWAYGEGEWLDVTGVSLPEGLTNIGSFAFAESLLTSVTLPESVSSIGAFAFCNSFSLAHVTIPDGSLNSIGEGAFYGCPLVSVTIPACVTSIGEDAFDPSSDLTIYGHEGSAAQLYANEHGILFISLDGSGELLGFCGAEGDGSNLAWSYDPGTHRLTVSGSGAMADFAKNEAPWVDFQHAITAVELPEGLTSIGAAAFYCCDVLANVTIPDGVTRIGDSAFAFCEALTSVTIPNGVTSISAELFLDCCALTSVTLPDGVTEIQSCAFFGCTALNTVKLPENLKSIGTDAFMQCTSMRSITIPAGTESFGSRAFGWYQKTSPNYSFQRVAYFTVYGWTGSAAWSYATANGFTFIPLDDAVGGFLDVAADHYYAAPVLWAVENGVTIGTGEHQFSPEKPCTRAQIMTFLWRAAGKPEPTRGSSSFDDVPESAYYYKAVLWAVQNGITTGTSAGKFSPKAVCSRAQAVTFLWRAAGKPEPTRSSSSFDDIPESAYYYKAVLWAVQNGITTGTSTGKFSPGMDCTRGQIATFLYRDLADAE